MNAVERSKQATMPDPIRTPSVSVRETAPRMTPPPPSRRFAEVLAQGSRAILQGAVSAVSFVPGGNMVAAAIRGAPLPQIGGPVATPAGGTVEAPAPGAASGNTSTGGSISDEDLLARGQEMSMRMLRLQEAISEENRRYTALSNVLHARHEMAKNAIGNIR